MLKNLGKEFGSKESETKRKKRLELRLPLCLSMIRRVVSPQTDNVVDVLEELQALDEGQPDTPPVETRPVLFSKGDEVALRHNWKRYLEPFFLAILHEDLHRSNDGILQRPMHLNWLELKLFIYLRNTQEFYTQFTRFLKMTEFLFK